MPTTPHEITQLLLAWSAGDKRALERLMPLVYDELHRLAKSYMQRAPHGATRVAIGAGLASQLKATSKNDA